MVPKGLQTLPMAGGSWGLGSGSGCGQTRPPKGRIRTPSDLAQDFDSLPSSFCCRRCQCVFLAGPTWATPLCPESHLSWYLSGLLWGGEERGQGSALPALNGKCTPNRSWLLQNLRACSCSHQPPTLQLEPSSSSAGLHPLIHPLM